MKPCSWIGLYLGHTWTAEYDTSCDVDTIKRIGTQLAEVPKVHLAASGQQTV